MIIDHLTSNYIVSVYSNEFYNIFNKIQAFTKDKDLKETKTLSNFNPD